MIPRVSNWSLKLIALFLAILLWVVARIEAPDRQSMSGIPIQVIVNDPDWTLVGPPEPATVDVAFSGPIRGLLALGGQTPPLRIVLDDVSSADTLLTLSRDWVVLAPESSVAVDEVQPATVRLTFDQYQTTVLAFEAVFSGTLDTTLALAARPVVIPARTRVRGPSRLLSQMTGVPIEALDLGKVTGSGRTTVNVDTSALADDVEVEEHSVEVELTIEVHLTRTFLGIPVLVDGADNLEPDPSTMDVTVKGAASLIESLTAEDIALVARAPVAPVGEEGIDMALTVRNLPEFVTAILPADHVRLRPQSAGGGGR